MKRLAAALLAAVTLGAVAPASAFVAEVTTSVAVPDTDDQAQIKTALESAVDGVLKNAIGFEPTLVVLTRALVVGDRLYVRLLLADKDGEKTFKDLAEPEGDDAGGDASPGERIEL